MIGRIAGVSQKFSGNDCCDAICSFLLLKSGDRVSSEGDDDCRAARLLFRRDASF